MLPAAARLRRSRDFAATVRRGRRSSAGALLVVHVLPAPAGDADGADALQDEHPARAGFVVGRSVGGAVVRNGVRRRLRHLVSSRLASVPPGTRVVIRALPSSASASTAELERALDLALGRVLPGGSTASTARRPHREPAPEAPTTAGTAQLATS